LRFEARGGHLARRGGVDSGIHVMFADQRSVLASAFVTAFTRGRRWPRATALIPNRFKAGVPVGVEEIGVGEVR